MELIYDWRSFQSVFFPRRQKRSQDALTTGAAPATAYFVTDSNLVIAAYADNEDLSEWIGAPVEEVLTHFQGRTCRFHDRLDVDRSLGKAATLSHFYEQVRVIQTESQPKKGANGRAKTWVEGRHFLLDALHGWWAKLFPSAYGIFLRISPPRTGMVGSLSDADGIQDFLMIVRRGEVDAFLMPDFSNLKADRREKKDQLVRYLSEKHMIPVQGVFVTVDEWATWSQSADPWKEIAAAMRADHEKLYPFKWSLVTLMATRAYFGV